MIRYWYAIDLERLADLLVQAGSLARLAKKLGISPKTISDWFERDNTGEFFVSKKLAKKLLEVDPAIIRKTKIIVRFRGQEIIRELEGFHDPDEREE